MEHQMSISVIGTGNMAQGLAALFSKAGYDVILGSRDKAKAAQIATTLGGNVSAEDIGEAAARSDVVVLAIPFDAAKDALVAAGNLDGKVVIDITNPLTADYSGLTIGHTTSAAEEIQKLAPRAKVVKAFNTVFSSVLQAGGKVNGTPVTVFLAGDDVDAKQVVSAIVGNAGLSSIDAGGLSAARYLEPLAGLNIALGYGQGHGTDIAPAWLNVKSKA
jgi:NADPH-dependent F420 reductase